MKKAQCGHFATDSDYAIGTPSRCGTCRLRGLRRYYSDSRNSKVLVSFIRRTFVKRLMETVYSGNFYDAFFALGINQSEVF